MKSRYVTVSGFEYCCQNLETDRSAWFSACCVYVLYALCLCADEIVLIYEEGWCASGM